MIIGRGLVANALANIDDDKYIFYANGISNSVLSQIPGNNFEIKEIEEWVHKIKDAVFIYFSTSQVNAEKNRHRPYVKHKLFIEQFIAAHFPKYLIIRTSNLVGYNPWNGHTLFNFLYHALHNDEEIVVDFEAVRNFLDADHLVRLMVTYFNYFEINKTIEIVNPDSYTMHQIITEFENYFSRKFKIKTINSETDFALFELDTDLSKQLMKIGNLNFENHIESLLKKYYNRT